MGGICCHVLNRGNARAKVFRDDADYESFIELMGLGCSRVGMRVVSCCLMPNHFHLILWPRRDGDLGRWMQWVMTSHVRRHHRRYGTSGHVWGGRFKSFPIQRRRVTVPDTQRGGIEVGNPLLVVARYVERNPLRAGLVERAEQWRWSSLRWWGFPGECPDWADLSSLERPGDWLREVNRAETEQQLATVRRSVVRGRPFGTEGWVGRIASTLHLESTLRPRGRPKKPLKK